MDCKHELEEYTQDYEKVICVKCFRTWFGTELAFELSEQNNKMNAVVEYFAQLLCDNPDLVGELCVCEGYEAGLDNLGQACPICDDRSPLWIKGQEIKALDKVQRSDSK